MTRAVSLSILGCFGHCSRGFQRMWHPASHTPPDALCLVCVLIGVKLVEIGALFVCFFGLMCPMCPNRGLQAASAAPSRWSGASRPRRMYIPESRLGLCLVQKPLVYLLHFWFYCFTFGPFPTTSPSPAVCVCSSQWMWCVWLDARKPFATTLL